MTEAKSKSSDSKSAAKPKASLRVLLKSVKRAFLLCLKLAPKLTIQLIVITVSLEFFPLIQNGLFGKIINEITEALKPLPDGSTVPITYILGFILLYVLVMVVSSIFRELSNYISKRWDLTADHQLDMYTLKKKAGLDIAHYEDPEFQNLMNRAFDTGTWPLHSLALGQIRNIGNIVGIIAASAIVFSISPSLLIISLLSAIPNFVIELKYSYNMWGIWSENSVRQRQYYALRDHIQGKRNIIQTKMLQASNKILTTITGIMSAFLSDQLNADKKRLWLGIGANMIMALGIGYAIYQVIAEVLVGNILPGTLVFAVYSLQSLVATINGFLTDIAAQYKKSLTVKDIFEVFDTAPRILESIKAADSRGETDSVPFSKPPHVEFRNVSFKYPSKNPETSPWVFKDLNFEIRPGEKIGMVGQNGAGKSTLIKLLMRVYDPTEGAILIDGTDLRDLPTQRWSATLSVLLQQYSLHEFSIEGAIAMGLPDGEIDSAKAVESALLSGADEFINEYPQGYKQQVSREFEDGVEPSQGQLQKIALARALYRMQAAQILILDEPTAAIDPLAELEIFEKMEQATKDKTLILITHRFNSVRNVDKILVLDGHSLAEQGTHAELMKKKGVYASMFEGQAKGFSE